MTITDHTQMNDLGKVMRKMSAEMNEMAAHMEKGGMDEATVIKDAGKNEGHQPGVRSLAEEEQMRLDDA
jgi:hypothetical protein